MDISEVMGALGKQVRFRNSRLEMNGVYILTGCILRKSETGFYYQAELTRGKTVYYVSMKEIETENGGTDNGDG